jgi:rRNA maturation RNase YbeY
MKLTFTLTETAAARASYPIPKTLIAEMKRLARSVTSTELAEVETFELSVVLQSDSELLQLNQTSLGHDWYTDIITFEIERTVDSLEAELYLSVDRARDNARKAKITTERELVHLVIHGILHLAGYDDHDPGAKKLMKQRERFYLAQL